MNTSSPPNPYITLNIRDILTGVTDYREQLIILGRLLGNPDAQQDYPDIQREIQIISGLLEAIDTRANQTAITSGQTSEQTPEAIVIPIGIEASSDQSHNLEEGKEVQPGNIVEIPDEPRIIQGRAIEPPVRGEAHIYSVRTIMIIFIELIYLVIEIIEFVKSKRELNQMEAKKAAFKILMSMLGTLILIFLVHTLSILYYKIQYEVDSSKFNNVRRTIVIPSSSSSSTSTPEQRRLGVLIELRQMYSQGGGGGSTSPPPGQTLPAPPATRQAPKAPSTKAPSKTTPLPAPTTTTGQTPLPALTPLEEELVEKASKIINNELLDKFVLFAKAKAKAKAKEHKDDEKLNKKLNKKLNNELDLLNSIITFYDKITTEQNEENLISLIKSNIKNISKKIPYISNYELIKNMKGGKKRIKKKKHKSKKKKRKSKKKKHKSKKKKHKSKKKKHKSKKKKHKSKKKKHKSKKTKRRR